jgi:hypothetical protein
MSHIESKLSREQAIALVSDLSGGQEEVVRLVAQAFDRSIPEGHEFEDWNTEELPLHAVVAASMLHNSRSVSIDWASTTRDAADAFALLLQSVGIDAAPALEEASHLPTVTRRGSGAGIAYVPFRKAADEVGMRILDVYDGSDAYCLVIVSSEVAERWSGVELDETGVVADADHQFDEAVISAGIAPRHLPENGKTPPEVPGESLPSLKGFKSQSC